MKREKILPLIGFTLLLVCFSIALTRVFSRQRAAANPDEIVIRIAHWQLESGIRDAIDALARDYERLHPGVRIEQNPIPERIYPSWLRTQLVGGTAPDLIEIGKGSDDETLARFFVPLTEYVELPNPYNAGTSLAPLRWRDTFVDGLAGGDSYKPNLLEYYGVPLSMITVRMYYNVTEWKRILGDTPPPADYDAFVDICERVQKHAASTGETLFPIAGSNYGTPWFASSLIGSQTQRLAGRLDDTLVLKPNPIETALQFATGRWTLDEPDFVNGLSLARQIGRFAQPGFIQANRDDATFYFVQGRALMIVTGSWDAPSFRALAPFELSAFRLPMPSPDHPRFGAGTYGLSSEADTPTSAAFGLTRASRHREHVIDFLHFLTSQKGNSTFSRVSGWLPSVVDIELPPLVKPFEPVLDGHVNGIGMDVGGGADVRRVVDSNLGALFDANVDVAKIQGILRSQLPDAVRSDLMRTVRQFVLNTARQDTLVAAQIILRGHHPDNAEHRRKQSELLEAQTMQELRRAWILHELEVPDSPR
ncbi:MAG: transporter substrate-binding protein [Rariglobus sp.]|jgi:raffinose/stachyose/melibiose transport system substrate-binding protein|nr:transporter substrate-binding protein [Rariglobus sp.]